MGTYTSGKVDFLFQAQVSDLQEAIMSVYSSASKNNLTRGNTVLPQGMTYRILCLFVGRRPSRTKVWNDLRVDGRGILRVCLRIDIGNRLVRGDCIRRERV